MIKFDINSPPPSTEQIEAERKLVENERFPRIARMDELLLCISGLALGSVYFFADWEFSLLRSMVFFIALMSFAFAIMAYVQVWGAFDHGKAKRLFSLAYGIDERKYPKLLESCRIDPLCDAYRLAVIKQGRQLTVDEANMLILWASDLADREKKEKNRQEQAAASLALHSTAPLFNENEAGRSPQ